MPADRATSLRIRQASESDVPTLLALIRSLAVYEKAEHEVKATEEDLRREGFGPQPAFECILAEVEGRAAGFALFFHSFSTWEGRRGLYIEDLFVEPWARGLGLGERLVAEVAALAVARGCPRLDLSVLDWNPARGFYEKLGLRHRSDWVGYRIDGEALQRLARKAAVGV